MSECAATSIERRLRHGESLYRESFVIARTLQLPCPSFGWTMRECTIQAHPSFRVTKDNPLVNAWCPPCFKGLYPFGANILITDVERLSVKETP